MSDAIQQLIDDASGLLTAQPAEAISRYEKILRLSANSLNNDLKAQALHGNGIAHHNLGHYREALDLHIQCANILETTNHTKHLIKARISIANNYLMLGDYLNAIECYQETILIAEASNERFLELVTWRNLSLVYKNLGEFGKALEIQQRILKVHTNEENKQELASVYDQIGVIYDELKDWENAVINFEKAVILYREQNNARGMASSLCNLGMAFNTAKNYSKSAPLFSEAISVAKSIGFEHCICVALCGMGDLCMEASDSILSQHFDFKNDRSRLAINFFEEAYELAKKTQTTRQEYLSAYPLANLYELDGDYKKALVFYKISVEAQKKVSSNELKTEIAKRELQFEFERKEAILRAEAAETETKALRSQMNPHFIFNSLNSISDYINKNDLKNADYFISKFAKLMRLVLENSEKKEVRLADDLRALQIYLELEALRMKDKFSFEIKVDETLDAENTLVPPLLLQPFVENSIWHGIANKKGTGKITVCIAAQNEMLRCIVQDDGIGRTEAGKLAITNNGKSLGMKITMARIDLLNRVKNMRADVNFTDLPQGLRVEVKLPLELIF
jgi:tetratricopeptide (TPR) repeat protein